jgi:putative redox protein
MDTYKEPAAAVRATIDRSTYRTTVFAAGHTFLADEPVESGGTGTGPTPFELLLASLASCTVMTLRMYIDRKMWNADAIHVDLQLFKLEGATLIERNINIDGKMTAVQKERLAQIANACPVHKILSGQIMINTVVS